MTIQNHRNEDNRVAQKDGQNGLPPVHTAFDERRGEHISRNAQAHGNPQSGVIPSVPRPFFGWDGGEVFAEKVVAVFVLHIERRLVIDCFIN